MKRRFARGWLALAGIAFACGGGDEPPKPVTTPMGHRAVTDAPGNQPPAVERVSLEPQEPLPGSEVRATVKATDPDGDPVTLRYEWRLDGERLRSDGPAVRLEYATRGQELEVRVRVHEPGQEDDVAQVEQPFTHGARARQRTSRAQDALDPAAFHAQATPIDPARTAEQRAGADDHRLPSTLFNASRA